MPPPPVQLYAGSLQDFTTTESMAREIELAVEQLMGLPPGDPEQRRQVLIAIAQGVINHLKQKEAAFRITVSVGFHSPVTTTPDIQVRPPPP